MSAASGETKGLASRNEDAPKSYITADGEGTETNSATKVRNICLKGKIGSRWKRCRHWQFELRILWLILVVSLPSIIKHEFFTPHKSLFQRSSPRYN